MGTDPPTEQHVAPSSIETDDTTHIKVTPPGVDPEVDPDADPNIGRVVSERYRILSKLGEGGMGKVYLAEHVRIEKKVALKILSDDFARKADLVARFMQEAKAASRIGHENIVDITDFGETDAGSVFFAMEHLEGADLAAVIREQGPMPLARAIPILTQICRALGAAHGKGIVHRDVKPENIFLIERDGKADFVKILDFGIAKMSSLDETGERLTRTGMIFGTPEYMSPEQARGDRSDHRVDIYAVGCIAYEMLTGDVPFHAETFMGVLTKHMFEPPDALAVRAPEAKISPDVEAVVMRALAKNRDERYQTMRDLALAFGASEGGDGEGAWRQEGSGQFHPMPVTPGPTPSVRGPNRTLPIVVALGLIVAGVVAFFLWIRPAQPPAPIVVAPAPAASVPTPAPPPVVMHKITINSPVPGWVHLGDEIIGELNKPIELPHSMKGVALTVVRDGRKDRTVVVYPDQDRNYAAPLEQEPRGATPAPRPSTPPPKKGVAAKKAAKTEALAPSPMPTPEVKATPVTTKGPAATDLKVPNFEQK